MLKKNIQKYFMDTQPYLKRGYCPTKDVLASITDKWSMHCILNLGYYEKMRFGELKRNIDGISPRMLSVTLKRLEAFEIVNREEFPEIPPRVEYSLSVYGEGLASKLVQLSSWVLKRMEEKNLLINISAVENYNSKNQ
ncbi:winged helix-turn-helix transcriptional regulator [Flagellimonas meridianipacifica]|uniref:DNA-binding HxlR family transcriptional regulator n=1 Tax=Flagellimonas meridianipacifica TaxID=1080225 RepID=A0A2T0MI81_9FLAO|nr:helix-turn-helix domain-containing protein [Allomuricauda pacifica]PRX57216.1 DNA-binding HxlR family transcriptional regulator [Allomuricauda pacifica]